MTIAQSISSIGHVCSQLQSSYAPVRKAIEALGIKPAVTINLVDHFSDEDVERIREHLNKSPKR